MERILVNTPANSNQHTKGLPCFTLERQNNKYQVTDLKDDDHWVWDDKSCKDAVEVLSKYPTKKSNPKKVKVKLPNYWNDPWETNEKCRHAIARFYYGADEICSLFFSGGNEQDWTNSYIPRFIFQWSGKSVSVSVVIQILSVMQCYIDERAAILDRKVKSKKCI